TKRAGIAAVRKDQDVVFRKIEIRNRGAGHAGQRVLPDLVEEEPGVPGIGRRRPVDEHGDLRWLDPAYVHTAQARAVVDGPGVGRYHGQSVLERNATDDFMNVLGILAGSEEERSLGELLTSECRRLIEDVHTKLKPEQLGECDHGRVVLGANQITNPRSFRP